MSDDKKQLGTRVQNYIDRLKELHSDRIVIEKPEDFQNSKLNQHQNLQIESLSNYQMHVFHLNRMF